MPEEEKVYCSMYSRNAELYHHGIKGQKWGVRNGPPYPLGSDVSTGSRLKKTDSRAGGIKKSDNSDKKVRDNQNEYYNDKKKEYDLLLELDNKKKELYKEYSKTKECKSILDEMDKIVKNAPKYIQETEDPDDIKEWMNYTKEGKRFLELQNEVINKTEDFANNNSEVKELLKQIEKIDKKYK